MAPAAIPITTGRMGQFSILSLAMPSRPAVPIGVFLLDSTDPQIAELHCKLRDDWSEFKVEEDEREYLEALAADFQQQIQELGGEAFLRSCEESLSGVLRISDRENVAVTSAPRVLQRLFDTHVENRIARFVTHLPYYSVRAAATRFGEDSEVEELDWVRAPEGLRLTEGMFVAQVVGRSMEPLIPDGSLCIFRAPVVGSRQGKRLLIEARGVTDSSAQFTVKRYTSRKHHNPDDDDSWQHEAIRLEPLNPDFQAFELSPDEFGNHYRVIAEFVQVL